MTVYKVEADYAPRRRGLRTEPGTNSIEYFVRDRELAKEIAESYVLVSEERDTVEWIHTSDTTYELAHEDGDSPLENVHAKVEEIEVRNEMPEIWTADQRREAITDANA
jgi:hypothetical protein